LLIGIAGVAPPNEIRRQKKPFPVSVVILFPVGVPNKLPDVPNGADRRAFESMQMK